MRKYLLLSTVALVSFTGTAVAAEAADPEALIELAKPVYHAVMAGQYAYAVALAIVLLVAMMRNYGARLHPWLGSGNAARLYVGVASLGGALATAFGAGEALSLPLLWSALKVGAMAAGGFALLQKPLLKVIDKVKGLLPLWMTPLLSLARYILSSPVDKAEQAGFDALAKTPATGTTGIVGEPEELK